MAGHRSKPFSGGQKKTDQNVQTDLSLLVPHAIRYMVSHGHSYADKYYNEKIKSRGQFNPSIKQKIKHIKRSVQFLHNVQKSINCSLLFNSYSADRIYIYTFMGMACLRATQDFQKQGSFFSCRLYHRGGNVSYHKCSLSAFKAIQ